MSAEAALEFFERVHELEEDTEDARIEIIEDLIEERYEISVFKTGRTPDQIAADYSRHGNVLHIKTKEIEDEFRRRS